MMEENSKCCNICGETKNINNFLKDRNYCNSCGNEKRRNRYKNREELRQRQKEEYLKKITDTEMENKCCSKCGDTKTIDKFYLNRSYCKDCHNKYRNDKYKTDEEHQIKIKEMHRKFKNEKAEKRRERREEKLKEITDRIGIGNKICPYCDEVYPKDDFRHNRQKCIHCERKEGKKDYIKGDVVKTVLIESELFKHNEKIKIKRQTDPVFKFLATQRSRIGNALKKKQKHTVEYLGCSGKEFEEWLSYNFNENYSFSNHGTYWHIDHVIPISTFNLEDPTQHLLCLNLRNTVPLSAVENLSKNNKIIPQQIEQHYKKLLLYHQEKNIKMPQEFIDLFMRHAQIAGNS
jgi:uncharacterized protein (DUF983 family)